MESPMGRLSSKIEGKHERTCGQRTLYPAHSSQGRCAACQCFLASDVDLEGT